MSKVQDHHGAIGHTIAAGSSPVNTIPTPINTHHGATSNTTRRSITPAQSAVEPAQAQAAEPAAEPDADHNHTTGTQTSPSDTSEIGFDREDNTPHIVQGRTGAGTALNPLNPNEDSTQILYYRPTRERAAATKDCGSRPILRANMSTTGRISTSGELSSATRGATITGTYAATSDPSRSTVTDARGRDPPLSPDEDGNPGTGTSSAPMNSFFPGCSG